LKCVFKFFLKAHAKNTTPVANSVSKVQVANLHVAVLGVRLFKFSFFFSEDSSSTSSDHS